MNTEEKTIPLTMTHNEFKALASFVKGLTPNDYKKHSESEQATIEEAIAQLSIDLTSNGYSIE